MLNLQLLLELDARDNLQRKYQTIWVAYSGGVDSHVLLELAAKSFSNVRAVHVNHGAHPDDDQWQQHCAMICAQLNVPLHSIKVEANPKPKQSYETAARNARRNAWKDLLTADDLLLVAHHADDQAETILYRLLRGTGPRGLTGMQMYSKIGNATLLRPLLNTSKQEILAYAQAQQLNWIVDRSNQDNSIDRNYIRNNIMPQLQARWPQAANNINRAGAISGQMLQEIEPQVAVKLASMLFEDAIDLTKLAKENEFWQQELLRAWLKQHSLIPSMQHLKMLKNQVINARIDAMPRLHIGNKIIKRSGNKLFVLEPETTEQPEFFAVWDISQSLALPNGQSLQAEQVFEDSDIISKLAQTEVTVRMGVLGRKAKKVFQQHAIPPWERMNYPLVFANERLVSVVGLWRSTRLIW